MRAGNRGSSYPGMASNQRKLQSKYASSERVRRGGGTVRRLTDHEITEFRQGIQRIIDGENR